MTRKRKLSIVLVCIVVILLIAAAVYVSDYYRPLAEAAAIAVDMVDTTGPLGTGGGLYLFGDSDTAFIIYPGGKVAPTAYAPLAKLLNDAGHTAVIAPMPLHLAILNPSGANAIIGAEPELQNRYAHWYMIGHSLGGTAMSMYAAEHMDLIDGVVFLGSYPYRALSGFDGLVLDIQASEDGVINREAAGQAQPHYPPQTIHHTIQGGSHAGFGAYGPQRGDGAPTITWQEQHEQTAALILASLPTENPR